VYPKLALEVVILKEQTSSLLMLQYVQTPTSPQEIPGFQSQLDAQMGALVIITSKVVKDVLEIPLVVGAIVDLCLVASERIQTDLLHGQIISLALTSDTLEEAPPLPPPCVSNTLLARLKPAVLNVESLMKQPINLVHGVESRDLFLQRRELAFPPTRLALKLDIKPLPLIIALFLLLPLLLSLLFFFCAQFSVFFKTE